MGMIQNWKTKASGPRFRLKWLLNNNNKRKGWEEPKDCTVQRTEIYLHPSLAIKAEANLILSAKHLKLGASALCSKRPGSLDTRVSLSFYYHLMNVYETWRARKNGKYLPSCLRYRSVLLSVIAVVTHPFPYLSCKKQNKKKPSYFCIQQNHPSLCINQLNSTLWFYKQPLLFLIPWVCHRGKKK